MGCLLQSFPTNCLPDVVRLTIGLLTRSDWSCSPKHLQETRLVDMNMYYTRMGYKHYQCCNSHLMQVFIYNEDNHKDMHTSWLWRTQLSISLDMWSGRKYNGIEYGSYRQRSTHSIFQQYHITHCWRRK